MQNADKTFHAFTRSYRCLSQRILTDAFVESDSQSLLARALWDTGATGTCISTELADKLGLIATGKMDIKTPSGSKTVNTYLVNIVLPNQVGIRDVRVCDTEIGNQGIDLLIGMDVILLGDFSISNYNGNTLFSFRIPSKKATDFVKELQIEKAIGQKHGKGKRK